MIKAEVISTGDLPKEVEKAERAVQRGVSSAGSDLKARWRTQVAGALGARMARTIRSASYPKMGASLNAAARVWTNAPEIIGPNERGAVIRSANGFFLAIPLPAAGTGRRGKRITPGEWEAKSGQRLRFVYRRGAPSLLVADAKFTRTGRVGKSRLLKSGRHGKGAATIPIFVLVPQVRLRKRLALMDEVERVAATLPSRILRNWQG